MVNVDFRDDRVCFDCSESGVDNIEKTVEGTGCRGL